MCAQPIRSTDGSATGAGALPGSVLTTIGSPMNGLPFGDRGELGAELAVGQVQRALPDQPEGGGVPERGGAAVAEHHLVAVGQAEQLTQTRAHPRDDVLDRLLPVTGAEHRRPDLDQGLQLFGPDLGGTAAEASVDGLEVGWDYREYAVLMGTRLVGLLGVKCDTSG